MGPSSIQAMSDILFYEKDVWQSSSSLSGINHDTNDTYNKHVKHTTNIVDNETTNGNINNNNTSVHNNDNNKQHAINKDNDNNDEERIITTTPTDTSNNIGISIERTLFRMNGLANGGTFRTVLYHQYIDDTNNDNDIDNTNNNTCTNDVLSPSSINSTSSSSSKTFTKTCTDPTISPSFSKKNNKTNIKFAMVEVYPRIVRTIVQSLRVSLVQTTSTTSAAAANVNVNVNVNANANSNSDNWIWNRNTNLQLLHGPPPSNTGEILASVPLHLLTTIPQHSQSNIFSKTSSSSTPSSTHSSTSPSSPSSPIYPYPHSILSSYKIKPQQDGSIQLELNGILPPNTLFIIEGQYLPRFLPFEEFPPGPNRGFEAVPSFVDFSFIGGNGGTIGGGIMDDINSTAIPSTQQQHQQQQQQQQQYRIYSKSILVLSP